MAEYETIGQTADILKTLHVELEDQFNSLIRYVNTINIVTKYIKYYEK